MYGPPPSPETAAEAPVAPAVPEVVSRLYTRSSTCQCHALYILHVTCLTMSAFPLQEQVTGAKGPDVQEVCTNDFLEIFDPAAAAVTDKVGF